MMTDYTQHISVWTLDVLPFIVIVVMRLLGCWCGTIRRHWRIIVKGNVALTVTQI